MKTNRFFNFFVINMLAAFSLYHFKKIDINQMPAILFASVLVMAYNLAKDSDKEKYAFSWSFLFYITVFTLTAFMITPYSLILGVISLVFIFLNFADSSEYKQSSKEIDRKEIVKEDVPEIQPTKILEYNAKDIIWAKNTLLGIDRDSKEMAVELVVPQNITYLMQAIEDLSNKKMKFNDFVSWLKLVNNNCYVVWTIIENDNNRIDTLECLQRIMSITKPLLDKYGGDCFIETK